MGLRLATQIPNSPPQWQFTVVTQPGNWAHEPLGLPGGYVFVPAALFVSAENEAELAAMLAHSMVHAAWPAFVRLNRENISFSVPWVSLDLNDSALVPIGFQAAGQEREIQADALALQILSGAGFDPGALLAYLERRQTRRAGPSRTGLTDMPQERLTYLSETLASLSKPGDARLSSSAFVHVQDWISAEERVGAKQRKLPSLLTPND